MASRQDDRLPTPAARPPGRFEGLRRHRRWLCALAVVALLAQMAVAMVTAAVQQTPTIDEPVYVGTAETYVREHTLRFNPEHPPLGKLIIASGLVFAHPHLDAHFTGDQTALGRRLLYESGNDPWRVMLWARLPVIVLTLLFGLVVFAFARELVGGVGGLMSLALYAFSPDVIAHGSLATLDVPAAGFLLTSVWLVWRARRQRPLLHLALAGVALGAAAATKMSTLPAVPVLLLLAFHSFWSFSSPSSPSTSSSFSPLSSFSSFSSFWHARRSPGPALRAQARLVVLGVAVAAGTALVALAVIWATYLVVDPQLRWATPANVPAVHGLRGLAIDWLPAPRPYRDGMRIQFGFENATWSGFLFGRLYHGSLWYYLPAALLVKTPIGMLVLWLIGLAVLVAVPRLRPAAPYVLLPPAVLLAVAMTGSRDLGVRYALFVPVFLAVAAAGVLALRHRWAHFGAAALVLFVGVSSLRAFPYYLPYSNEAFGGPSKTHLRLHDSNVDWGQDLGRLADRLAERYPSERVWLVYKGSGVPSSYGIEAADPRKAPPSEVHGLLAVSDSAVAKADGRLASLLDGATPVDEVGYSITIYRRR
ncbi:glycosyltransferase family 39 protein [Streptomyces sp. NBC_01136]|uniref:ArnT family glycosyltransferase n=1 Tax=Streptomyces sp. NBC_01136 TaxID=2903754 RepID=UPI0038692357|nr:glycosyltransferase family 39 protein [Streptomyces sp. NBC_01136]